MEDETKGKGGCNWSVCSAIICCIVFIVVAAGGVYKYIEDSDDSSSSSSSSSSSPASYDFGLSAAVSLAGITAQQFDTNAQNIFKETVGTQVNAQASAVTINSVNRRSITVDFTVGTSSLPTAQNVSSISSFLSSADPSTGFAAQMNANLAANPATSSLNCAGVTVMQAVTVITPAPTSAPTSSPVSGSTAAPTGAPTPAPTLPWTSWPSPNPNWTPGLVIYVDQAGDANNNGLTQSTACDNCGCAMAKINALGEWPEGGVEVRFSSGKHVLGWSGAEGGGGSCGQVSERRSTAASPLVFSGDNTVIDATQELNSASMSLVTEGVGIPPIHPSIQGQNKLYELSASGISSLTTVEFDGVPLMPSQWPNSGRVGVRG